MGFSSPASALPLVTTLLRLSFATVTLLLNSCTPVSPNDGTTRIQTAAELVRSYRDEPVPTAIAYDNQRVRLRLPTFDKAGPPQELRVMVSYGLGDNPPVLVLRADPAYPFPPFDSLKGKTPLWVEGVCRGRTDDGLDRRVPGYTFKVLVTGCRLVDGPYDPPPPPGAKP